MDSNVLRQRKTAQINPHKESLQLKESKIKDTDLNTNSYFLTRIVLVRFLAFIYAIAFLIALNQNHHLLGKNGLTPANKYMDKIYKQIVKKPTNDLSAKLNLFFKIPTIFWFFDWSNNIDNLLLNTSLVGLILSTVILIMGSANSLMMLILWLFYHAIVNIGQTWYSFGWESQLLESGFIAIFMVPFLSIRKIEPKSPPSFIHILLYRWLIFRIMLGAGLIKIRGDNCWRDLTCMNYHYETQPVPNPLAYYMHKSPEIFHKFEVLSNHFIELIAPFFILTPFRGLRLFGGLIQIFFQLVLITSGNLSFLNWLTILPSLAALDDRFLSFIFSKKTNLTLFKYQSDLNEPSSDLNKQLSKKGTIIIGYIRQIVNVLLFVTIAYLSVPVIRNLMSNRQAMNTSYDSFRIVNTYGAFGSVTKERNEVIFKGTHHSNDKNKWLEYEFNCKPGSVKRTPCVISPYHYRLDWLMWFAAFGKYEHNPWFISLASKFLLNDKEFTKQMIAKNPFENSKPPILVRADLYSYKYTTLNSTSWWERKYVSQYLPPVSVEQLKAYIDDLGWDLTVEI